MKKFLLAILFLSAFPSITMAQTTTCIDLKNNMLRGAKNANTNNEVIVLQKFLKAKGFLSATPNGSFGPATLTAVKKFQSSVGIGSQGTPGYGGVGPKSRAKIKEMTCSGSQAATTLFTNTTTAITNTTATQTLAPIITSFYSSPNQVISGQTTTLYWDTINATNCSLPGRLLSANGSTVVGPLMDWNSNFTLTCNGQGETVTKSITVPVAVNTTSTTTTIPATFTNVQNQATTYQLQSAYFRNDATAQSILLNHPISLRTILNADGTLPTDSFALKFMNGLRQVGYNGTAGLSLLSPPSDPVLVVWLHKFQRVNNLPQSDNVGSAEIAMLDKLVLARESVDTQLASLLPISLAPTATAEPSSNHVAALLTTAFKALPTSLFKWTSTDLTTYIKLQGIGVRGQGANGGAYMYTNRGACLLVYSDSLDSQCNSTYQTVKPSVFEDDFSLVFHTLHEYAHYLDASLYTSDGGQTSKGIINTHGFDSISFDTSAICDTNSGWRYFYLRKLGNERNEFVTNYAIGGTITGKDGCRSSSEDFADSFAMYVTQGSTFRKLAETKPVLAQKYTWLKDNVFGGKEYYGGSPNNIPSAMQLLGQYNSPALLLPFYIDYLTVNPNFVWDYSL